MIIGETENPEAYIKIQFWGGGWGFKNAAMDFVDKVNDTYEGNKLQYHLA